MKVIVLAGGFGTRLAEITDIRPKPMVEIGGQPILWHILKHYSHHGFKEFLIALGYKGEVIKRYFLDYKALSGNLTVNLSNGHTQAYEGESEDWVVDLVDTGLDTGTGGRVKRLRQRLRDETFMLTYGDGVSNVDIGKLVAFHRAHGKLATVTAVRPPARYGGLLFDGDLVAEFTEKPQIGEGWINGGFLVCEPGVFDYLTDDASVLETDGLEHLARDRQLIAYRHEGFWQCADTLRDVRLLERLWQSGQAEWRTWK